MGRLLLHTQYARMQVHAMHARVRRPMSTYVFGCTRTRGCVYVKANVWADEWIYACPQHSLVNVFTAMMIVSLIRALFLRSISDVWYRRQGIGVGIRDDSISDIVSWLPRPFAILHRMFLVPTFYSSLPWISEMSCSLHHKIVSLSLTLNVFHVQFESSSIIIYH